MAQNKRRRLESCVASDPYIAELNKINGEMDEESSLQSPRADSNVATKRESGAATSQTCFEYLDRLNQKLKDYGEGTASCDAAVSGESSRALVISASSALAHPHAERQLSQRRAVAGNSTSSGKVAHGLADLKLQEKLGSGAFGSVFKCTWKGMKLAVKIHRAAELDVSFVERELQLLRRLSTQPQSSFICHLQAWRNLGSGRYLFFFEPFPCDLRMLLQRRKNLDAPIGVRQAMRFALNLSAALAFAHSRRVIHRDLKPANILLRRMNSFSSKNSRQPAATAEPWHAVVADFGNSAIVQRDRALQNGACSAPKWAVTGRALSRRVCTLWYAAPEMLVLGEGYGYPADIWSLGLVLLEIEAKEAACPTRPGAADWEQLRAFWRLCQPAAATCGFLLRARQELARNNVVPRLASSSSPVANCGVGLRSSVGQLYGSRFRAFANRLLNFDPQRRVAAQTLSSSCQQAFQNYAPLPPWWLL